MRLLIGTLILVGLMACKKNEVNGLYTGSANGFEVTEHNLSLKTFPSDNSLEHEAIELDISGDNVPDLGFTNWADSVPPPVGESSSSLIRFNWVNPMHEGVSVAEVTGADRRYEGIVDTTTHYSGTLLFTTYHLKYSCSPFEGSYEVSDYPTANTMWIRQSIDQNLDWEVEYGPFILSRQAYESATYELQPDLTFEGTQLIVPEACNNFVPHALTYLPFRFEDGSNYRYGWVELSLDDDHGLTIYRSAIEQ